MLDLNSAPRLDQLSEDLRASLNKVDNYALDYNIFLFKGMQETIASNNEKLLSILKSLFVSIPKEYLEIIHNPIDEETGKLLPTTTSQLQNRLLSLLIQERHRRDIENLNKQFEDKIKYVQLDDPHKYEIKSLYFKTFDEGKEDYQEQFNRLALLQCLEYDFEHVIDEESDYQNDDDLIDHFCDESILNFKLDDFENEESVLGSEIVRFILPLASQAILSNDDEDDDKEVLREEEDEK
jgi:hypothetical protein